MPLNKKNKYNNFIFSPIIDEFQSDKSIEYWFRVRLKNKSESTITNAYKAMAVYLHYLRNEYDNHITPCELIEEAFQEQSNMNLLPMYRKLSEYLDEFHDYLSENYSTGVQQQYIGSIKGFYLANGIQIDPKSYRVQNVSPHDDNIYLLKKKELRKALNECNKVIRCMALCQISSGISKADLVKLTVRQFNEGYDKKHNICRIDVERQKTGFAYHTFFSSEACNAINDYLHFRMAYSKKYDELTDEEKKQYIYSDDDVLFSKPQPRNAFLNDISDMKYNKKYTVKNKYAIKPDEITPDVKYRKFKPKELNRYFVDAAKKSNLRNEGHFSYFRCHNLRRFFSSELKNVVECRFDFKEHWMGHKQGSSDDYDKYDKEVSKNEYLKIMKYLTIGAAEELQDYQSKEHEMEIKHINELINSTKAFYDNSINDIKRNIDVRRREINDIDGQLKNNLLPNNQQVEYILERQKWTAENAINRLKEEKIDKRQSLEFKIKQLEDERDRINEKYNSMSEYD